jgi:hypothetical protein
MSRRYKERLTEDMQRINQGLIWRQSKGQVLAQRIRDLRAFFCLHVTLLSLTTTLASMSTKMEDVFRSGNI